MRAAAGSMSAFLRLHSEQAATTFSQVVIPPFERGTTWSNVRSSRWPQYWQGERARGDTLKTGEAGKAERLPVALQRHPRGQAPLEARAADQGVIFGDDVAAIEDHRLDRVLP